MPPKAKAQAKAKGRAGGGGAAGRGRRRGQAVRARGGAGRGRARAAAVPPPLPQPPPPPAGLGVPVDAEAGGLPLPLLQPPLPPPQGPPDAERAENDAAAERVRLLGEAWGLPEAVVVALLDAGYGPGGLRVHQADPGPLAGPGANLAAAPGRGLLAPGGERAAGALPPGLGMALGGCAPGVPGLVPPVPHEAAHGFPAGLGMLPQFGEGLEPAPLAGAPAAAPAAAVQAAAAAQAAATAAAGAPAGDAPPRYQAGPLFAVAPAAAPAIGHPAATQAAAAAQASAAAAAAAAAATAAAGGNVPGNHAGGLSCDGPWLVTQQLPGVLQMQPVLTGSLVEFATCDGQGVIDGTALARVTAAYAPDGAGQLLDTVFGGASSPVRAAQVDAGLNMAVGSCVLPPLLVHLCSGVPWNCRASFPQRACCHADTFRLRSPHLLHEPWARLRVLAPHNFGMPLVAPVPGFAVPAGLVSDGQQSRVKELQQKVRALKKRLDEKQGPDLFGTAAKRSKRSDMPDDSESDGDDKASASLFQEASSRESGAELQVIARQHPGLLLQKGLNEMTRYLGSREGANGPQGQQSPARVVAYLMSIFHGKHSVPEVGVRSAKEMRTIAECLDALLEGRLPELGDLLMQRFKALETSVADKTWAVASQLELLPKTDLGLTSPEELRLASRQALLQRKLADIKAKVGKPGG